MSHPKILVFIPAYNCATQIKRVLNQFTPDIQLIVDTVIVVDNRSTDDTLQTAQQYSQNYFTACHYIVMQNNDNYGLGGSHKVAFSYAFAHNFDYLIVLHGDDQATIHDAYALLKSNQLDTVDCHLGSRFMQGSKLEGYSFIRTLGNHFYNLLFSLVVKHRVHDLGSGLNIYKISSFRSYYFRMFPDDLTFNYVMLLASYHKQQTINYFPISWREYDQTSNVRLVRQSFRVLKLLWGYLLNPAHMLTQDLRRKDIQEYTSTVIARNKTNA
ncbi:MAG: glycosyltransferase family 2 protein [Roseiflexaceae bacterium]